MVNLEEDPTPGYTRRGFAKDTNIVCRFPCRPRSGRSLAQEPGVATEDFVSEVPNEWEKRI